MCFWSLVLFAGLWVAETIYCRDVDVTAHFLLGISPDRGAGLHWISLLLWFSGVLLLSAWSAGELSVSVWRGYTLKKHLHSSFQLLKTDNFMYCFLAVIGAIFAFEVPYTLLYDMAHRNALVTGHFWLSLNALTISRNFGLMFLGLLPFGIAKFYKLKLRFDKRWVGLTVAMYLAWLVWVFPPFSFQLVQGDVFPQTVYNFYEGFGNFEGSLYVPDLNVWSVNFLLVKPLVTLWFLYPFFYEVREVNELGKT